MGNTTGNKETVQSKKGGGADMSAIYKEYTPAYEECKHNPKFFTQHFTEVPKFASNLKEYFPKVNQNFDAFFQMAMYLRRQEQKFTINLHAKTTAANTNLIDRYLMIVLKLSLKEYQEKTVSIQELDQVLMEYFKIFVKEPEKGSAEKLLKFLKQDSNAPLKLKGVTDALKEQFPSAIRSLKDYYALKFKKLQKNAYLLTNFSSRIINNDAIILALRLNRLTGPQIKCLYNTDDYGLSFHSIQKQLVGYTGPWLLLLHHTQKNEEGERDNYIFGSYQSGPIRDVSNYQGDLSGFIFSLQPNINFLTTDRGEGDNKYFWLNTISNERFNKRRGIGFGGDQDKKNFKLWIDQDLDLSTVYSGKDKTYGFGNLATYGTDKLHIKRLQIWGLGHQFNLEDQKKYWEERQIEIMKRRKVDKKQFFSQNAGIFFQKTFEHREQVVGQIEKRKQKEEDEDKW